MIKRWQLRRGDYAATRARRQDFRALLAEHVSPRDHSSQELVFGELITNAVRHGANPMSVSVAVSGHRLRIYVENGGDCFELDRRLADLPAATATGGRGLQIVNALVDKLTIEHSPFHTCRVTATMPL